MDRETRFLQLELDFSEQPSLEPGKKALNDMLFQCYLKDLASENPRLRRKGAKGLASLGTDATATAPLLEKLLQDPDWKVREAAKVALGCVRASVATMRCQTARPQFSAVAEGNGHARSG